MKNLLLLICLSSLFQPSFAQDEEESSGDWSGQGEIAFEARRFENDSSQNTKETNLSILSRLEQSYEGEGSKHVFRAFARVDRFDEERSILAMEDAYASWYFGEEEDVKFLIGYKLFNWTATEAFHPADSINSRNYDSDLENLEKKGELVVELNKTFGDGEISFYLFPRFESPEYPGSESRLGLGVDLSKPEVYDGTTPAENRWVTQYGARLGYSFDFADIGLHVLQHVDRGNPLVGTNDYSYNSFLQSYVPSNLTSFTNSPTPYYFEALQIGATMTVPLGLFIFKFEGATRTFEEDISILTARGLRRPVDHQEAAVGLEIPISHDDGSETNFFVEATGVFGVDKQTRSELNIFQRDAFIGLRHAFNDEMGTEVFLSMITDIERDNERLFNASYTRRLSDTWKIKTGLRVYDAPKKESLTKGLEAYDGDNHVHLSLTRYF